MASSSKKLSLVNDNERITENDGAIVQNSKAMLELRAPMTTPVLYPEIWEGILKELPSQDFLSVINSCPEWRTILMPYISQALFSQVLPLLLPNFARETILECRRVGKDMKSAVDDAIQKALTSPNDCFEDFNKARSNRRVYYNELERIQERYCFATKTQVDIFLRKIGPRDADNNPFPTRKIQLHFIRLVWDERNESLKSFLTLLSLYGHHLWRLDIYFAEGIYIGASIGAKITKLLTLVPNIKVLTLDMSRRVSQLVITTLPQLEQLASLEILTHARNIILLPFLHKYGCQLTMLECQGSLSTARTLTGAKLKSLLPNLQKLCVTRMSANGLQKLSSIEWRLEHLRLLFSFRARPMWQDVVRTISAFKKTLVKLEVMDGCEETDHNYIYDEFEEVMGARLPENDPGSGIAPNLRVVASFIDNIHMNWFWDVLSMCPSLNELHLADENNGEPIHPEIINIARRGLQELSQLKEIVMWHETLADVFDTDLSLLYEKQIIKRQ